MKIKYLLTVLTCIVLHLTLFAQNPDANTVNAPQVIPPAPASQLFEQYVNCPVSYETGIPDITIPLYEIEVGGMKIPINLSYHASGIKYKQFDGDVAVGWVLNPGYRITRSIYGKQDENYDMKPGMENASSIASSFQSGYLRDKYLVSYCDPSSDAPTSEDYKHYDGEYDHFCYMLPGSSAHFIISDRKNKGITILEKDNYKINYMVKTSGGNKNIEQFNVTDDDGFIYQLGNLNGLVEKNNGPGLGAYTTAWPLVKMTSPTGRSVDFGYIKGIQYLSDSHKGNFIIYDTKERLGEYTGGTTETPSPFQTSHPFFLSTINSEKEYIKITRDEQSSKNFRIKTIEIYRKIPTQTLIKKVNFIYSTQNHHCMLDAIEIYGENNSETQCYNFTYYPGTASKLSYPDQWGYSYGPNSSAYSTADRFFHKEFANDYYRSGAGGQSPTKVGASLERRVERNSNNTPSLYGYSLKSVTFPTKGRWELEYEPNQFVRGSYTVNGAGLRIKQITMYDGSSKAKSIQYKYGLNQSGNGIVSFDPHYKQFAQEALSLTSYNPVGMEYICSYSPGYVRSYSTDIMGNASVERHFSIYYPEVTVYEYDETQKMYNGKTIKRYTQRYSPFLLADLPPRTMFKDRFGFDIVDTNENTGAYIGEYRYGSKPYLVSESAYSYIGGKYNLVSKDSLQYKLSNNNQSFTCFHVEQSVFPNEFMDIGIEPNLYNMVNSLFFYFHYKIYTCKELLWKKTSTLFTPQGSIVTTESYTYDSSNRLLTTTTRNSKNEESLKEYTYPTPNDKGLIAANMVSKVIKTRAKHNGKWVGTIEDSYTPTGILPFQTKQSPSDGKNHRVVLSYEYNSKNNIKQITTVDGVSTTYLWSYNGQYPVAEIKNATYDEVQTAANDIKLSLSTLLSTGSPDMTKVNLLRNRLPKSQVTTYTYKPLIGVLTVTDPSGKTTYYNYDHFGRLQEVYIQNRGVKEVVEYYDYNNANR